ncbi:MAG: hypothetical protein H0T42_21155, partial [Deltaproteobacteria bacterium]|nr:hypothetical protein [Deltaproteobacteria bacterium]
PAVELARFGAPDDAGVMKSQVVGMFYVLSGVVVAISDPKQRKGEWDLFWIDHRGSRALTFAIPGLLYPFGPTADGSWWVTQDYGQLWRVPPTGAPIKLELGYEIPALLGRGDRMWALSNEANLLLVLDLAGTTLRRISIPAGTIRAFSPDAVAVSEPRGASVTLPASNVRFVLPAPLGAIKVMASERDGVFAVLARTRSAEQLAVAVWQDPVPRDPAALRAYLATLTNAQLEPGSDALTWAAAAAP